MDGLVLPLDFFSWFKETHKNSFFLCLELTALLRIMTNIFLEGGRKIVRLVHLNGRDGVQNCSNDGCCATSQTAEGVWGGEMR
jgi:hypothetical protein